MNYATKVWHRGYADWAWIARDRRGDEFASGSAESRAQARSAALEAVNARTIKDDARWVPA